MTHTHIVETADAIFDRLQAVKSTLSLIGASGATAANLPDNTVEAAARSCYRMLEEVGPRIDALLHACNEMQKKLAVASEKSAQPQRQASYAEPGERRSRVIMLTDREG